MKRIIVLSIMLSLLYFATIYNAHAFRCGDGKLASKGMHKYQILKDCGPPVSKEVVGVDKNGGSYRIVEEWLYIVNQYGYNQMYLIKFDGNGIAVDVNGFPVTGKLYTNPARFSCTMTLQPAETSCFAIIPRPLMIQVTASACRRGAT